MAEPKYFSNNMKHLISLKEQSAGDLLNIINLAIKLKKEYRGGKKNETLFNKTLIMLFQKTSTRTRLSFESAMTQLGGHAIYLDSRTSQLSMAHFEDEIRAIMQFGDVLMFRALKAVDVQKAAALSIIPVIDACSEKYHPAQALGDILTMIESAGSIKKIGKVVWLGIENNVSNTLMLACSKLGIEFIISAPEIDSTSVDKELNKQADKGKVSRILDVKKAVRGAGFIHTDTWLNMEFFDGGKVRPEFKDEFERRKKVFAPYQLNAKLVNTYAPKAKIMHCMPCHIDYEITRDAVDHKNSIIFQQAQNRLHIEKAIILWLLGH
ncbi:MAG: hypothetical protein A3C61_00610 [Candidatus Yanofskybacteria bacterium RIFCSPHIGHO2_02_FULL_39_10]|uniref:Ornithine carbamoyltransferase n=1 Tax=Candidatus Yanofskybacteria bacterium RIFCSPHIGHO2_02_FULL_39_10 TaxID=1802674 RepID=A0A1F8F7K6_9BACT|nr:MAG: hypothetical protein A3C61_00610 [Candidatus Yanofskybacteria bacterium RIFCSPHIGHO2_02_FULL_39_10]